MMLPLEKLEAVDKRYVKGIECKVSLGSSDRSLTDDN